MHKFALLGSLYQSLQNATNIFYGGNTAYLVGIKLSLVYIQTASDTNYNAGQTCSSAGSAFDSFRAQTYPMGNVLQFEVGRGGSSTLLPYFRAAMPVGKLDRLRIGFDIGTLRECYD